MSRCRRRSALLPYVDGELDATAALLFEDHLAECASCSAAVDAQHRLEEALVALPARKFTPADRTRLRTGIGERIDAAARAPAPRTLFRRPAFAAAAAIFLAVGGSAYFWPRPKLPAEPALPVASNAERTVEPADVAPPALAPAFDARAVPPAIQVAARNHIARFLPTLADEDDPLALFVAAVRPLRDAGIPVQRVLLQLLEDDDGEIAAAAADLFARGARASTLGRDEPTLVLVLEAALARFDRAPAMLRALVAVGTPRAWQAVAAAAEVPALRRAALIELAAREEGDVSRSGTTRSAGLAIVERQLARAQKSGDPEQIVPAVLGHLRVERPDALRLLVSLLRGGAAHEAVAAALARNEQVVETELVEGLRGKGALSRRDALVLAPLAPSDAVVAALAELALRNDTGSAALAALTRIGGAPALCALARLAADPSLPRSRAHELPEACRAVLAALPADATDATLPATLTEAFDRLDITGGARGQRLLLELCLAIPGDEGRAARSALLAEARLTPADRARIGFALVERHESVPVERVVAELAHAVAQRDAMGDDGGLTASLLVLLYTLEGDDGLTRGLATLELELSPAGQDKLRRSARSLAHGSSNPRDFERLDELLHLAP